MNFFLIIGVVGVPCLRQSPKNTFFWPLFLCDGENSWEQIELFWHQINSCAISRSLLMTYIVNSTVKLDWPWNKSAEQLSLTSTCAAWVIVGASAGNLQQLYYEINDPILKDIMYRWSPCRNKYKDYSIFMKSRFKSLKAFHGGPSWLVSQTSDCSCQNNLQIFRIGIGQ